MKNTVLAPKATWVTSVFSTVGSRSSHVVNGTSHPPKKNVAISADMVMIAVYSAMKNIENFIAEYSV